MESTALSMLVSGGVNIGGDSMFLGISGWGWFFIISGVVTILVVGANMLSSRKRRPWD